MALPKNLPIQWRTVTLTSESLKQDDRSIELVASTEECIVDRWWGREQLVHEAGCIVMDRAGSEAGIAALWGHDAYSLDSLVGRIHDFRLDAAAKVTRCTAKLATTEDAEKILTLIKDGALRDVSIGYRIHEVTIQNPDKPDELYRITRWEPLEVSFVSIPADPNAGVGRSADPKAEYPVRSLAPEPPNPPANPAGTVKEIRMDPIEAAALKAAEELRISGLLKGERMEALQLQSIAGRMGLAAEAQEILGSDKPLAEARAAILALVAERGAQPLPQSLEDMGASDKELKAYSYARLLDAAVSQHEGKPVKCLELDIAQDIKRSMPSTYKAKGDFFAPFQLRAAMDSKTATAGKELVFTQPGELIELLRNKLTLAKLGARFLTGLRGPIGFSKQTGAAIAQWIDENGGVDAIETAATTGLVTLSPKTLIGTASFSRQLLTLGTYDAELMVRQDLAFSHAAAIDLAGFHGTGGTQPTGIYALAGVNSVAMGGNPTYAKIVDMLVEIATDNALMGSIGIATNPRVAGKLLQTLEFAAAGAKSTWTGTLEEGIVAGYKAAASNQLKSNLGAGTNEQGLIAGAWDQLIVGQFGNGFELITDPYRLKKQGLIEVTSFEMADLVARHAESFCKSTGVILT